MATLTPHPEGITGAQQTLGLFQNSAENKPHPDYKKLFIKLGLLTPTALSDRPRGLTKETITAKAIDNRASTVHWERPMQEIYDSRYSTFDDPTRTGSFQKVSEEQKFAIIHNEECGMHLLTTITFLRHLCLAKNLVSSKEFSSITPAFLEKALTATLNLKHEETESLDCDQITRHLKFESDRFDLAECLIEHQNFKYIDFSTLRPVFHLFLLNMNNESLMTRVKSLIACEALQGLISIEFLAKLLFGALVKKNLIFFEFLLTDEMFRTICPFAINEAGKIAKAEDRQDIHDFLLVPESTLNFC